MSLCTAAVVVRPEGAPGAASTEACRALMEQGVALRPEATLDVALPLFEETGHGFVPVVRPAGEGHEAQLLGAVFHVDALGVYNRALAATAAEEHS